MIAMKIAFFIVYCLYFFSELHAAEFGMETKIWPHMWEGGSDLTESENLGKTKEKQWIISEENLDYYRDLGGSWNIVVLRQPKDNKYDWRQIDKIVQKHKEKGVEVYLRLIEIPSIYDDFLDKPDKSFGFNKQYYFWIKELASRLNGKVRYFLIGNELDHGTGHNLAYQSERAVSVAEYEKLLFTARMAISSSATGIKMVDHGTSSFTLGLLLSDNIRNHDGWDKAAEFWRLFHYGRIRKQYAMKRLKKLLFMDEARRKIDFAKGSLALCKYYDAVQLHHYFSPDAIEVAVDWVLDELSSYGCNSEIIATEIGYRIPFKPGKAWDGRRKNVADHEKYSAIEHAETLVKDFVILLSRGIDKILYWQMRFHHNKNTTATLFESNGKANNFVLMPAGKAYRYLAKTLGGGSFSGHKYNPVDGVHEYLFSDTKDFSVMWCDPVSSGKKRFLLSSDVYSVRDMFGNRLDIGSGVEVTDVPVYVFWKKKQQ